MLLRIASLRHFESQPSPSNWCVCGAENQIDPFDTSNGHAEKGTRPKGWESETLNPQTGHLLQVGREQEVQKEDLVRPENMRL